MVGVAPAPLHRAPLPPLPKSPPRPPRGPAVQGLLRSWWVSSDSGRRSTGEGERGAPRGLPWAQPSAPSTPRSAAQTPLLSRTGAKTEQGVIYPLSCQPGGCWAAPGWESQDLRSQRCLKAEEQKQRRGALWRGCLIPWGGWGVAGRRLRPPLPCEPETTPCSAPQGPAGESTGAATSPEGLKCPEDQTSARSSASPAPVPRVAGPGEAAVPQDQPAAPTSAVRLPPARRAALPLRGKRRGWARGRQLEGPWGLGRFKGDQASPGKSEAQAATVRRARTTRRDTASPVRGAGGDGER